MRIAPTLIVLLAATAARADLPSPRLDRVFPLGGAAGSTVEVEIAGADLDDATALRFDRAGLTATPVKDRTFRVTIAPDVPPGTYDVRAVGRYGVSSPRLFEVSRGLAEVLKKKGNHDPATAQPVAVNTVVTGTVDANREDVYRFPARAGQRVVVECRAQVLDSALDGTLTLADAAGKPLASNGDYFGRDPLVDFVAPKDGDYLVSLADLSFRGGHPYRLAITDRPHVESVFPRAVQAGKPATLTVFGRNLGKKAKPTAWAVNDLPLDGYEEAVTPPDVLAAGAFRFAEHPTTHSVQPTAATSAVVGFQVVPTPDGSPANPVPVVVCDTPVSREAEPNDDPAAPQPLTLPAVVSGRFDKPRDADWFAFTPEADGPHAVEVYCERIAGRADPVLVVLDDKDTRVADLDDAGPRVNAFDAFVRDPGGVVNLQAKRKYRVLVQDRYGRGGARYQYVLTVRKAAPDFFVAAVHHQNPGPGGTTLRRGGAVHLDLVCQYRDGFAGPVTVTADGLPKGVHAVPTVLTGDPRGVLVLWADADAPAFVGPIALVATGARGDTELRREVRPYTRVHEQANLASSRPTREQILCVLPEPAPFAVRFPKDRVEVEAGQKAELAVAVDRPWPDFKGAVTLIPLGFPGTVQMGTVVVADGKADGTVTLTTQAGTKPGVYTLAVTGQGQVPFGKDPAKKANTLVAVPSRPVTLVVKPAAKK